METWAIHNRINLYLLDAISDEVLGLALPKCRTVFDQFAQALGGVRPSFKLT